MKDTKYKCDLCTNEDPPEHMVGLQTAFLIDGNRHPTYRLNGSAPRLLFISDLKVAKFHLCSLCFEALGPAFERWYTRTVKVGDCDQGMAQRPHAVTPVKQDDILPQPEPKTIDVYHGSPRDL